MFFCASTSALAFDAMMPGEVYELTRVRDDWQKRVQGTEHFERCGVYFIADKDKNGDADLAVFYSGRHAIFDEDFVKQIGQQLHKRVQGYEFLSRIEIVIDETVTVPTMTLSTLPGRSISSG